MILKTYEATFHLLSSRNNAERLDKAIKNLREAKGTEHQLCEESEDSSKK